MVCSKEKFIDTILWREKSNRRNIKVNNTKILGREQNLQHILPSAQ